MQKYFEKQLRQNDVEHNCRLVAESLTMKIMDEFEHNQNRDNHYRGRGERRLHQKDRLLHFQSVLSFLPMTRLPEGGGEATEMRPYTYSIFTPVNVGVSGRAPHAVLSAPFYYPEDFPIQSSMPSTEQDLLLAHIDDAKRTFMEETEDPKNCSEENDAQKTQIKISGVQFLLSTGSTRYTMESLGDGRPSQDWWIQTGKDNRTSMREKNEERKTRKDPRGTSPSGLSDRPVCVERLNGECAHEQCNYWHSPKCFFSQLIRASLEINANSSMCLRVRP
jgi:hypothetical protein